MKYTILLLLSAFGAIFVQGQTTNPPTVYALPSATVTGILDSLPRTSSLPLAKYSLHTLETKGPYNLSDALASIPGISQMSTGNAISKPVIRGLYGNRILVLLSGLRFDNQQFQDEHGLGLSQIGIDRIEVIKGPASILYGTDAIGGVINVIEETPATASNNWDINTRLYSNTLGTLTDVGYQYRNNKNSWFRLRGGIESHADYSDGSGTRVLNSRNNGYYAKAGAGFQRGIWTSNNSYNFSYNEFGFIIPNLSLFLKEDDRFSRTMKGPHHIVILNVFSSQNTFRFPTSILKVNVGYQNNQRKEDEGGGSISLNMQLQSALENAKWEKQITGHTRFVMNQQLTYETNTNFGKRILIPDATMLENNLSAFTHTTLYPFNIELGVGYNQKQIQTLRTNQLNSGYTSSPDTTLRPFDISRGSVNVIAGVSFTPDATTTIKGSISTGNRAPNLAELSSNGMHEGYYRYEIGNPSLKMEQNICANLSLDKSIHSTIGIWNIGIAAYYNRFYNYIYLDSTGVFYGFPVYRFKQQDAHIYGSEVAITFSPKQQEDHTQIDNYKVAFTSIDGVKDKGGYLPFIPAYKSTASAMLLLYMKKNHTPLSITPEWEYYLAQTHPSQGERTTPDYSLVHLNLSYNVYNTISTLKNYTIQLAVRNLLNVRYVDHLSRLQDPTLFPTPIYNAGINFVLSLKLNFDGLHH